MTFEANQDLVQSTGSSIISDGAFVDLVANRAQKLLRIARFLSVWRPSAIALTRPLVGDLLSHSRQIEELLDTYGARNNRQWSRFRSLVATMKLFADVTYELLHIHHSLPFYRLLPIERDFAAATVQSIEVAHDILFKGSTLILVHADCLGLAVPTEERRLASYAEPLPPGHLPHDRPLRKIKNVAETVTHLATVYLNMASESEILNIVEKIEPQNFAACLPDPISEDTLRFIKVRFHCLQSLYDTYVSGTEIECLDEALPTLRGHISIVFHLLEIATHLVHYYERHLNVHTGDSMLRRNPVIKPETLLDMLMNYAITFAWLYLASGQCFCYTLLKRYAETGRIEVPAPPYRGFHVRPSTLVARIVRHYGSEVVMELDGQSYDAGSPMDIFRINEKINAQKRRWLVSEIGRLSLPTGGLSDSEIKNAVLGLVFDLVEQGKIIIYRQPLHLSDEFSREELLLETVTKEFSRLQATGQLDIKTELNITFIGDKRVLSDLELLAKSGYGEDQFGNNIALPKELAYLHR